MHNEVDQRALETAWGAAQEACVVVLEEDAAGEPRLFEPAAGAVNAATLLCQVPADVAEVRRRDGDLAHRWRLAVRTAMGTALDHGYVAVSLTPGGHYVLTRDQR